MTLDETTMQRLRSELGSWESGFTNAELQQIYADADDHFDTTMAWALRAVMSQNSAKLYDYEAGELSEKESQVFKNLLETYRVYAGVGIGGSGSSSPRQTSVFGSWRAPRGAVASRRW